MTNYSLWGLLNPGYASAIESRINATGPIDSEGYLSRSSIWSSYNIMSFIASHHNADDTSVNVTLARNFNETMHNIGKSSLINYTEDETGGHAFTGSVDHTDLAFSTYVNPVIVPSNGTLKIPGYVQSKRIRIEFLETINRIGEIEYNLTNLNDSYFNLTTVSYTGNVSITIYNFTENDFYIKRNGSSIIVVENGTPLVNEYQANYSTNTLVFIADNITSYGDYYEILVAEETTEENLTTDDSLSSSGGSSGTSTYYLTETNLKEGYTQSLGKGWNFRFSFKNESHKFNVDNINDNIVTITVSSDPLTFDLKVNESKKVDLDSDGYYDFLISLNEITESSSYARAEVYVLSIDENVVEGENDSNENNGNEGLVDGVAEDVEKNSWFVYFVLVLIIVVGIALLFIRCKERRK